MGEVYKARDNRLERDVAIKVLPERFAKDPLARNRFDRELKARERKLTAIDEHRQQDARAGEKRQR